MRIYISGPITGREDLNRAEFERARALLKCAGHDPLCPLDIVPKVHGEVPPVRIGRARRIMRRIFGPREIPEPKGPAAFPTWSDYMRADVRELMGCDAVYMLPGYGNSPGAMVEYRLAEALGMRIFKEGDEL